MQQEKCDCQQPIQQQWGQKSHQQPIQQHGSQRDYQQQIQSQEFQRGHQQPIQQQGGQGGHQQPIQQRVGYLHPVVQIETENASAKSTDQSNETALTQMKALSGVHIVVGVISIFCGILLLCLHASLWYIGHGIWIGCYFVVVGGIGIGAVRRNNSRWITYVMVLNIISAAVFCSVLLSLASVGVATSKGEARNSVDTVMDCMLIVVALIEVLAAVWTAVLCCGVVCACCKPTSQRMQYNDGTVQYNAAPGVQAQPMVMYANTPGALEASGAPGAPIAPHVYDSYPVQQQHAPYSARAVPQPNGYKVQPQAPPSYYSAGQSEAVSYPGYTKPLLASADPVPTKQ